MGFRNHDDTREVDQPAGAALMIRKRVLDQTGLMDEKIFLFFEDVDLCFRMKKSGWKIFFHPEAKILHHGARSISQIFNIITGYHFTKSRNLFFKKHYGTVSAIAATVLRPPHGPGRSSRIITGNPFRGSCSGHRKTRPHSLLFHRFPEFFPSRPPGS